MKSDRYVARLWTEADGVRWLIGTWGVFNTETNDSLFGDNLPKDQREAEQCARAANIAWYEACVRLEHIAETVNDYLTFK